MSLSSRTRNIQSQTVLNNEPGKGPANELRLITKTSSSQTDILASEL